MPMPDPRILNALLDYYYTVKDEKKTATAYGVLLRAGQAVGLVADHAQERKPKTGDFKSKIKSAQTIQEWINIAFDCGREAREAQAQRGWKPDCDYAKVMHAMRSCIIDTLTSDPKHRVYVQKAIEERLLEVTGDPSNGKPGLEEAYLRESEKSYIPEPQEKALKDKLYELSDLGHLRSCIKSSKYGFFELEFYTKDNFANLGYKDELCPSIPKCYQRAYYVVFYLEEGMKTKTKELTKNGKELNFTKYIKYLQSHQPSTTNIIADELVQITDNDDDDGEGHDFPSRDTKPQAAQPTRPKTNPSAIRQPPQPPQPNETDETTVDSLPPPPPKKKPNPLAVLLPQPGDNEPPVVNTIDPPPIRKHQSTPPKTSPTFFDDDGRLYPQRPAVSAPQLASQAMESEEKAEKPDARSDSPSLG